MTVLIYLHLLLHREIDMQLSGASWLRLFKVIKVCTAIVPWSVVKWVACHGLRHVSPRLPDSPSIIVFLVICVW